MIQLIYDCYLWHFRSFLLSPVEATRHGRTKNQNHNKKPKTLERPNIASINVQNASVACKHGTCGVKRKFLATWYLPVAGDATTRSAATPESRRILKRLSADGWGLPARRRPATSHSVQSETSNSRVILITIDKSARREKIVDFLKQCEKIALFRMLRPARTHCLGAIVFDVFVSFAHRARPRPHAPTCCAMAHAFEDWVHTRTRNVVSDARFIVILFLSTMRSILN